MSLSLEQAIYLTKHTQVLDAPPDAATCASSAAAPDQKKEQQIQCTACTIWNPVSNSTCSVCYTSLDQAKKEAKKEANVQASMKTPKKKKRRVEVSTNMDKKNGQDFSGAEAAIRNLVASIPGVQKLMDTVPGADMTVKSIVSGIPGAASLFDNVSSPQRNLNSNASKLTSTTSYNFRVERNVGGISGLHIA